MKKVDRPTGLIGYETDKNIERRQAGKKASFSLIRPRTILYAVLIVGIAAMMAFGLSSRATLEINVLRDRTPPYVTLSDGSVRNAYTVKILNKDNAPRDFRITVEGPEGLEVSAVGEEADGNSVTLSAPGDGLRSLRLFVKLPPSELRKSEEKILITVKDVNGGETATNPTGFMTGSKR